MASECVIIRDYKGNTATLEFDPDFEDDSDQLVFMTPDGKYHLLYVERCGIPVKNDISKPGFYEAICLGIKNGDPERVKDKNELACWINSVLYKLKGEIYKHKGKEKDTGTEKAPSNTRLLKPSGPDIPVYVRISDHEGNPRTLRFDAGRDDSTDLASAYFPARGEHLILYITRRGIAGHDMSSAPELCFYELECDNLQGPERFETERELQDWIRGFLYKYSAVLRSYG